MSAATEKTAAVLMLRREVGIFGAVMMGLGSILGTGIFVSIAIGAGIAGPAVILAIIVAAVVASCNGLSSAQLAANHPVSGGTYEYGYRWLHPALGFTAGWMFLWAKSASAATAALGCAGYLLQLAEAGDEWRIPVAVALVANMTLLTATGIRRSNWVNIVIVSITICSLLWFVLLGEAKVGKTWSVRLSPFFLADSKGRVLPGLLEATALMFVAYTGYGRIATLGEEMKNPRRNIPMAIIITLVVSMLLYVSVGTIAVSLVGPATLEMATVIEVAPLQKVIEVAGYSWGANFVGIGAVTAMAGVLLNLVLGLSRVVLAMGRRGDLPSILARLDREETTPYVAVTAVGVVISGLVLIGDVRTTWTFSAFTVLIYYAITNLAALRLTAEERLYPRWIAWAGLCSCLFLAFWVDVEVLTTGPGIIGAGLGLHYLRQRRRLAHRQSDSAVDVPET